MEQISGADQLGLPTKYEALRYPSASFLEGCMYVCDEEDSSRMVGVQILDRKQLQQSPACRWK